MIKIQARMLPASLQRTLSLTLIGSLALLSGGFATDAGSPLAQRLRVGRPVRLEADYHSDACHEGETHSLDAHFERHSLAEGRSQTAGILVAGESKQAPSKNSRLVAALPLLVSEFQPSVGGAFEIFPQIHFPQRPDTGTIRGRAPPASLV